jgi:hypothetical protein
MKSERDMPLGKAHSSQHAAEFLRLGWTLAHEFRAEGDDEPCEYLFEWRGDTPVIYPSATPAEWGAADGQL